MSPTKKKPSPDTPLTPKQERFCREYLVDLNGAQAAVRAGYSAKTAGPQGAQNLSKLNVKKRIAELQQEKAKSLELKAEDALREIAAIAYTPPKAFERSQMSMKDKLKALEMLAKHLGIFTPESGNATAINVNVIKTAPPPGGGNADS